ncbi:LCP family protein [Mycolicibacterium thermoresistibile]
MSDGDNATPDRRRPRTGDADDSVNQWITRSPRPTPGAAPWERGREFPPAPDDTAGEGPPDIDPNTDPADAPADAADDPPGNHSAGVTVADLIAKVAADGHRPRRRRSRRRAEPEPEHQPRSEDQSRSDQPRPDQPQPEQGLEEPLAEVPTPPDDLTQVLEPITFPTADADYDDYDNADTVVIPPAAAYAGELPDLGDLRGAERVPPSRIGAPRRDPARPQSRSKSRRNRRRAMVAGRVAVALIAASALVLTGGAWQWQSSKNSSMNRVSALDQDSRDILDPNAQFGDENFLIVGVDSRIGKNSAMGAGDTTDAAGARSDTVILVNIPANRDRVVAVSFPRDLAIEPMKCEPWNPETGEYGPLWYEDSQSYGPDEVYTEYKLNSAYAFGGPKCLVKVIQKLSGLSINRFMAVDFAGFSKMVDAMGGVEVCTTEPLKDYELGTVIPTAGRHIVDGHTALNYVRARQVVTEYNGDYGRIKRQQLFLSSLLRSLISKEVFFSLSKLNNVVDMFIDDSFVDNIDTKDLVQLGQSLQGVNAGRITFVTVPTGETDAYGNEPPRTSDMRALFDAIINDSPLPGEKNPDNTPVPGTPESTTATTTPPDSLAASAPTTRTVDAIASDPADITVQVSNSTGSAGLAASAAGLLEQHGFNVADPNDYPTPLTETTVMFSPGNEQAAATVASAFGDPTIEQVNGMGSTVQVVLGSDFYSVQPPSPSGEPVQVQVVRGTSTTPTQLPEDLTVTNAADTSCD